jgi:hypothetical protein
MRPSTWSYIGRHISMLSSLKNGVRGITSIIWVGIKTQIGALYVLLWIILWERGKNGSINHSYTMDLKKGDLVACYITNTHEWETLMCWGIVLEVNETLEDVRVLDNEGNTRWWPRRRWRILSKKRNLKYLDIDIKLA